MSDNTHNLLDSIKNAPLPEAYQYIIYELRECVLPVQKAMHMVEKEDIDQEVTKKLLAVAETNIDRAVEVIDDLMVGIFLHRIRHEFNK